MITLALLADGIQYSDADFRAAWCRVEPFLAGLHPSPALELQERGFSVQFASLSVPGAQVRGRIDLNSKEVLADPDAITLLMEKTAKLGEKSLDFETALSLILAHELYHALDPQCPQAIRELAAIVFSVRYLEVDYLFDV